MNEIKETCSCGGTIKVRTREIYTAKEIIQLWRTEHRHDATTEDVTDSG